MQKERRFLLLFFIASSEKVFPAAMKKWGSGKQEDASLD